MVSVLRFCCCCCFFAILICVCYSNESLFLVSLFIIWHFAISEFCCSTLFSVLRSHIGIQNVYYTLCINNIRTIVLLQYSIHDSIFILIVQWIFNANFRYEDTQCVLHIGRMYQKSINYLLLTKLVLNSLIEYRLR